jgi:hypothetical protein
MLNNQAIKLYKTCGNAYTGITSSFHIGKGLVKLSAILERIFQSQTKSLSEVMVRILELQQMLLVKVDSIDKRIQVLERKMREGGRSAKQGAYRLARLSALELLELPDTLRRSIVAIGELGGVATAEEVAEKTGRVRNLESIYLNQLVRMDRLNKTRKGRKVFFSIAPSDYLTGG